MPLAGDLGVISAVRDLYCSHPARQGWSSPCDGGVTAGDVTCLERGRSTEQGFGSEVCSSSTQPGAAAASPWIPQAIPGLSSMSGTASSLHPRWEGTR